MSDREVLLPDRALIGLLNNFNRRLMAAERRIRFPGAVRFDEEAGPTSLTLGLAANNIISMTLDRGRWFLLGGMYMDCVNAGLTNWDLNLAFTSTSITYPDVRVRHQETAANITVPFCLVHTVSLTAAETINLQARAFTSFGGTVSANQSYMIAVPA